MSENVANTIPTENTAICEHCGMKVKADAQFCSSCGKPVIAKPTKIFCQTCGTELEDGEMFCPKCGSSSSANKNAEALNNIAAYNESIAIQQPKKTKKKKFLNILLISLAVAVALALLTFFVVIPEVNYRMACAEMNKGNYDAAYSAFVDLGDYRDSKDMLDECNYQKACDSLDRDLYSVAIELFEDLHDYKDSDEKVLQAKYEYVLKNKNNYNETTYDYLLDLKRNSYKDSSRIYDDLYEWRVEVFAWNTSENGTSDNDTISRYKAVYCHFRLTGGTPDGSTRISYSVKRPNGNTDDRDYFDFDMYDGSEAWWGFPDGLYAYPEYGTSGTLSVQFYDDDGNLIGSGSVWIQ